MSEGVRSVVDYSGAGATLITVECHITNGLPAVSIIGDASRAVDEAKDRLRAGFANCSLPFPKKRITINLAPADIPKDSTSLDLAMAVSILSQSQQIKYVPKALFFGELSLDGSLNPVRGIIGRLLAAKKKGYGLFFIPASNIEQALLVPGIEIKAAGSLRDVYLDLSDSLRLKTIKSGDGRIVPHPATGDYIDLSEIIGQPIAKRALEIAAAGHHNILLHGPPGTGKSMLAKAMCGILPKLSRAEILEVTQLHSLSTGLFQEIVTARPFRSPHHTASTTALVGGGTNPRPGEATLAHRGVLFLDELPEFSHASLEALRQPLEDGSVTISRVKESVTYPARFILVATQNPCPCGYFGTRKTCRCSAAAIDKYQRRVSGPILDRIDLHLAVDAVDHARLLGQPTNHNESEAARGRIETVYRIQAKRFGRDQYNSSMTNKEIRSLAKLSQPAKLLLDTAAQKLDISARSYVRTVKVARTIADLAAEQTILPEHIAEALQYRQKMVTA